MIPNVMRDGDSSPRGLLTFILRSHGLDHGEDQGLSSGPVLKDALQLPADMPACVDIATGQCCHASFAGALGTSGEGPTDVCANGWHDLQLEVTIQYVAARMQKVCTWKVWHGV